MKAKELWRRQGERRKIYFLRELVGAGKIESVIDRRFPLEQIVAAYQ